MDLSKFTKQQLIDLLEEYKRDKDNFYKSNQKLTSEKDSLSKELESTKLELERMKVSIEADRKKVQEESRVVTQRKFDFEKEKSTYEEQVEKANQSLAQLGKRHNDLATLFDGYIKSYDDQVETMKLFLRAMVRTQELQNANIAKFNQMDAQEVVQEGDKE